jgi:hypothetical protein
MGMTIVKASDQMLAKRPDLNGILQFMALMGRWYQVLTVDVKTKVVIIVLMGIKTMMVSAMSWELKHAVKILIQAHSGIRNLMMQTANVNVETEQDMIMHPGHPRVLEELLGHRELLRGRLPGLHPVLRIILI